ncbi:MAG: ATP-binding protein [Candidatus Binatia bacterium]
MTGDPLDFRLVFEKSPDVVLVLAPDAPRYTMLAATDARLAITLLTREETIGKGLFEVFPDNPDDLTADGTSNLRASLDRVLATRKPDTMPVQQYDIRGPDGGFVVRYWSPRNIPVLSDAGAVRYVLHCVEDVTDLVRAGEADEELRGRTRQLEREVVAGSRELDRINRDLDAFSSSVSHDLRAPLRAIEGFSRLLGEDYATALDERGQGYVDRIGANVQKMSTVIDDLLRMAKITRATLEAESIDLSAMAEAVVADLRRAHPERVVTVEIAPGLHAVGDRRLIHMTLVNLIGNAWKYTGRTAAPRIEVGRLPNEPATFFVRDNGAGFAMAHAKHLFEPFQRLHGDEFEGTGVGLATVERIVSRHGGRVWAEAAVGQGATFFFTL